MPYREPGKLVVRKPRSLNGAHYSTGPWACPRCRYTIRHREKWDDLNGMFPIRCHGDGCGRVFYMRSAEDSSAMKYIERFYWKIYDLLFPEGTM